MSLDHNPKLPEDWDDSKVIPGELLVPDDLSEEDIPPGILVPYTPRLPMLRKTGSAAMVVAAATGRFVGLSARATGVLSRWFGVGLKSAGYLGWRYVRTHDFQQAVGGIQKKSDWNQNAMVRRSRWKLLGYAALTTLGLNLTGWWALVKYGETAALDWSWMVPPSVTGGAGVTAVTIHGRYRVLNPGMAPEQIVAEQDDPESDEPFPLGVCQSAEQVAECVSRALAWENIGTRSIRVLGHRGWGWEVDTLLKGANADTVNAAAKDLDGHFNIKKGGTLIEGDPQNAAHITLRLVTSNPFANMPRPAIHAPNSLDVADPHQLALCMEGSWFAPVLEGGRILVVGVSGSAKSTGVLRDLAEVITACHNAIGLDFDPVKDGLREFEGVMAAPPIRGNRACEEWLEHLVKMAKGRNVVRNRLKMGDTWIATRKHPAIFGFFDEYIYMSARAKELFIELNRLGKQSGIYVVAAGQEATSDALGDAIADSFNLRIMLAARHADIPIVLGSGAIGEGYRPDRLQPAQNKDIKNDAGQSYIKGAGVNRPLLYGWIERSRADIDQAVKERVEAGRPWFDRDTLAAAGLLHLADGTAAMPSSGDRKIAVDCAFVMANSGVDRMKTEGLVLQLADSFPDVYGGLDVDKLRALLKDAGAGSPVTLGYLDGEKNPRGFKLDALTALG
ncbi:hypothetical protein ACN2WE_05205 [Streptomyces sp. cg28]|uniref:hypothetical protein n=1 Tax=Streptomyces sp. cg28 TaxID=3403457 RepID=UPI003B21B4F6